MKDYARLMPEMYRPVVSNERKSLFMLWCLRFTSRVVVCPRCRRDICGQTRACLLACQMQNLRRYWCPGCHYRFSDFSGTFLSSNKLPWSKVIAAVHLFISGQTARQCAKLLRVNYKSARALFHKIRLAIAGSYKPKPSFMHYDEETDTINFRWKSPMYIKGKLGVYRHIVPGNKPLYLKEQEYKYYKQGGVLEELLRYLLTPLEVGRQRRP